MEPTARSSAWPLRPRNFFMLKTLAQYESAKILRESDFLFISEGEKGYL